MISFFIEKCMILVLYIVIRKWKIQNTSAIIYIINYVFYNYSINLHVQMEHYCLIPYGKMN